MVGKWVYTSLNETERSHHHARNNLPPSEHVLSNAELPGMLRDRGPDDLRPSLNFCARELPKPPVFLCNINRSIQ